MLQASHMPVRPVRHQFMSLCNRVDLFYGVAPGTGTGTGTALL